MKNSVLHQFEESLFEAILEGDRIRLGQQIIIAVSGGKDSMTLLYSMYRIADRLNVKINVVHVNHNFRNDSNNDQTLVDKFCTRLKINLIIDHLDPATKCLVRSCFGLPITSWQDPNSTTRPSDITATRSLMKYTTLIL